MAKKMIEQIREAEIRADEIVKQASATAQRHITDAREQGNHLMKEAMAQAESDKAQMLTEALRQSEEIRRQAEEEAIAAQTKMEKTTAVRKVSAVKMAARALIN